MNLQIVVEEVGNGWNGIIISPPFRPVLSLWFDKKSWTNKRSVINRMTRYLNDIEQVDPDREEDYVLMVNP